MKINNNLVDESTPPYIISEISGNHNKNINKALKLIKIAKDSGSDAVKLQTYHPDSITLNSSKDDFMINKGLWKGRTLHQLYEIGYTPWEWHDELFSYAREIGITIFSSPFDESAVDLLEKLNTPAYKIASFEIVDLKLINYVAQTKKPIIISTGMANLEEIENAIDTAREGGCNDIALLHCVSGYPSQPDDYNLKTIYDLKKRFKIPVGLSDHTLSNVTSICSVAFGASIIEKHITLNRNGGGVDDSFSIEQPELIDLVKSTKIAWSAVGEVNYDLKKSEKENLKFRRSIYFIKDIKKGERITKKHIKVVRPGFGLHPKFYDSIIGLKVNNDYEFGDAVGEEILEEN